MIYTPKGAWKLLFIFLLIFFKGFSQQTLTDELTTIDNEVNRLMEKRDIPGTSLVIVKKNQVFYRTYGYSDVQNKEEVTKNTLFELGSASKAFTGLLVAKMISDNKLSMDDTVSRYIPWFKAYYDGKEVDLTIRNLLYHTSGIPWKSISKIPQDNSEDALINTVRNISSIKLNNKPGDQFEYATVNYDILALIIENIQETSFEEIIQNSVFQKLGMNNTTIGQPRNKDFMAVGYKIGFFKYREYDAPIFKGNNAAGYVITNAIDLQKWIKFQLSETDSPLSSPKELTHKRDESVDVHRSLSYAMGWQVHLDGSGDISHGGFNPTFTSYVAFNKSKDLGIGLMANSNSVYTDVLGQNIMDILEGDSKIEKVMLSQNNDKTFSMIVISLWFYNLIIFAFIIFTISEISRAQRNLEKFDLSKFFIFLKFIFYLLPVLIGFYFIPKAFLGFNWEAVLVWAPQSLEYAVYSIGSAILISLIAHFLTLLYPHKNKYKGQAPQLLLISVMSGFANVILIIMVTSVIGSEIPIKYMLLYYALLMAIYLLGRKFVQVNLIKVSRGLVYDLITKINKKIFSTSYEKFERMDRGRVYSVLNHDVSMVGQSTNTILLLISGVITIIGAFIYLASIAFWAAIVTISLIVSLSVIYSVVGRSTNIYFDKARNEKNVFMRLINGMIDGFKELSLKSNKKKLYQRDLKKSAGIYKEKQSTADIRFVNAFLVGESLLIILLGFVSIVMVEIFPEVPLYKITGFVIILLYLIGPINGILNSIPELIQVKISYNRISNFINEIPSKNHINPSRQLLGNSINKFELKNVKFDYASLEEENNFGIGPISFDLQKGEIAFIIGGNGSGKTTLAKLICGLYSPSEGEIRINGRKIPQEEVGEYFSAVFSPSFLFKKLYNIDYKNKEREIQSYLKILKLDKKVYIKNGEFSTIDLSGGQRKRLALLQCYLEDSPIYLFDEWAADQDPEYRKFFYRNLLPEMKKKGKVVIAITHDDHYFDVADKILKMNNGKLEIKKEKHLNLINKINS
jgi:cyclic peptide transporter